MKPKDLKRPFPFSERRPYLENRVFYVPHYYEHKQNFVNFFGNDNPVFIEYCSGNGDWVVEKAKQEPGKNWIAVEKRFDRVQKIWSKLNNHNLENLLIVSGEAYAFTRHYVCCNSVEGVYINFPDPWPKTKHAKHRLAQTRFLDEVARILKENKLLTFVTDDFTYLSQTLNSLCTRIDFIPFFDSPYYTHDLPGYGNSWFEELWRKQGKQIFYTQFYRHESRI